MITNTPTDELLTAIETACKNSDVEEGLKRYILKLLKVVIDQNYFQFMEQTHVQHDRLAMGAPTPAILSEFYLQHLENSKIYDILLNFNITGYSRYDLIIHNGRKTDIEDLLYCFNNIIPKLNFTI
jgi:hypothetical protein